MKKTIQKLMAALLAVAMVCAMAIPAFATDGDATAAAASTGEGKITINNKPIQSTVFWIWSTTQIPTLTVIRRMKLGEPSFAAKPVT